MLVPIPPLIALPLEQPLGLPAETLVQPGERVLKGQRIARAGGDVSVPVHASTSGRVLGVRPYPSVHPLHKKPLSILIEPDGEDRWCEIYPVANYQDLPPRILQERIHDCGIVGLGGVGFPAHIKVREGQENAVTTLILNGMECEPYVSCDDRLLREKADHIAQGAKMLRHALQAGKCVIALRAGMDKAAAALRPHLDESIELLHLEERFPIGGEKQLIQAITGKEVPSGGLAIQIGVLVHNIATVAAVYRAVTHGEPLISRYVTVTGAVETPRNLRVLLGTPVEHCLAQCDAPSRKGKQVIAGGPMTGVTLEHLEAPVTKSLGCILVLPEQRERRSPPLPCIRCGHCATVCPARLLPQLLYQATRRQDAPDGREDAHRLGLFDCIECGCCAYVCPSRIPLVASYRTAKETIVQEELRREGIDQARRRYLERENRLRQEQNTQDQVQEQRVPDTLEERRAYISQAVARARARRTASPNHPPGNPADAPADAGLPLPTPPKKT